MPSWATTELWRRLVRRERQVEKKLGISTVIPVIQSLLDPAEKILASGGTIPLTFTLHDAEHARRVAERMWGLLPNDVKKKIDSFELALLLSSAYLHDIGMCPDYERVRAYEELLRRGSSAKISEDDRHHFLSFIDTHYPGREPPLADNDLCSEILAYWCRDRHNDWSERWIRDSAPAEEMYSGWIEDLIRLCRSHHQGLAALRATSFNARQIGTPAQVVNLRYLAALLRVADVLELDPERTPPVLLRHRHINLKSEPYWKKDHYITLTLEHKRSLVRFSARPPTAVLYKAVVETRQQIDIELETCAMLHDEGAFGLGNVPENCRFQHWPWGGKLVEDIREGADFIFIDADFRPHPKRVLELLAGSALYDKPFVAVRELLQNAIDAIHEQTAYERLADPDHPHDEDYLQGLRHRRKIWLRLEQGGDGRVWLICRDSGCGMTREIIEQSLLVAGSPKRPDVRALERRCKAAGFELTRIGQFGIGCLSYFMLADQVEILTRRSEAASENSGQTGWRFVIGGLDDFGELRPDPQAQPGTEVRLRLKEESENSPLARGLVAFTDKLVAYIRETVVWLPCCFELRGADGARHMDVTKPGWVRTTADLDALIEEKLNFQEYRFDPPPDKLFRRDFEISIKEACSSLRWFRPLEGYEPALGIRYRILVPYWSIDRDPSLLFFRPRDDVPHARHLAVCPQIETELATHGIRFDSHQVAGRWAYSSRMWTEVSFERSLPMDLTRVSARLEEDLIHKVASLIGPIQRAAVHGFVKNNSDSSWHLINAASLNDLTFTCPYLRPKEKWIIVNKGRAPFFNKCSFPLISFGRDLPLSTHYERRVVPTSRCNVADDAGFGWEITPEFLLGGGRLCLVTSRGWHRPFIRARVWLAERDTKPGRDPRQMLFPPSFRELLLVLWVADPSLPRIRIPWINTEHPLMEGYDPSYQDWADTATDLFREEVETILSSPAHAKAWLLSLARRRDRKDLEIRVWQRESGKNLLSAAFSLALGAETADRPHRLLVWDDCTHILSPRGAESSSPSAVAVDGLYFPDGTVLRWPEEPEWWLTISDENVLELGRSNQITAI